MRSCDIEKVKENYFDFLASRFILIYICWQIQQHMSSKVKLLQKQAQATPILLSSWMEGNGVSRFDQSDMVRRHWLKR